MYLFYDTETTGFATGGVQPRVVQLGAVLTDEQYEEVASLDVIIKRDGFDIPPRAAQVHGVFNEISDAVGVPLKPALVIFQSFVRAADCIVAHNIAYDNPVMEGEFQRMGGSIINELSTKGKCSQQRATPICKLPPTPKMVAAGRRHYKSPKLEEAVACFFDGEVMVGAHSATVDVRYTVRIWKYMDQLEAANAG